MRELQGFMPFVVIIMIVLIVGAHLLLSRTKFGLHTYAIGGNKGPQVGPAFRWRAS